MTMIKKKETKHPFGFQIQEIHRTDRLVPNMPNIKPKEDIYHYFLHSLSKKRSKFNLKILKNDPSKAHNLNCFPWNSKLKENGIDRCCFVFIRG